MDPHAYRKRYLKQVEGVEVERVEGGFKFKGLDNVWVGKEPVRFEVGLEEEGGLSWVGAGILYAIIFTLRGET